MTPAEAGAVAPTEKADELIRFVRETLGCGCPDEVVARITVEISENGERGLDVGGRLLVRVLPTDDVERVVETFPETVERLRRERDRRGFNRLRLVLAPPGSELVGERLTAALDGLAAADGRVHLHIAEAGDLPAVLDPAG
jgi:cytosine/adenosine deaminase-related metal-dependent hydrolase